MQKIIQKIMQLLKNKYFKAGIGFSVAGLLLRSISFISTPIFSRLMDPGDYGIYNTFISYEGILYLFIGLAVHSSIQNSLYEFKGAGQAYVSSLMKLLCISVIGWLAIANLFSSKLTTLIGFNTIEINILILYSFSTAVLQILQSYLVASYNYKKYLLLSCFNAIGNVLLSIFLLCTVLNDKKGFARIVGSFVPIFLIAVIVCARFIFRHPTNKDVKKHWRFALEFSIPIIPHGISQIVLNQFDRIMIQKMISDAAAGLYSFGYTLAAICSTVAGTIQTVFTPWFYKMMDENTEQSYAQLKIRSSEFCLANCVISAAVITLSPELLSILGPKSYSSSVYCAIPILVGAYFTAIYILPANVEYYYKKTKSIAFATTTAAVINIITNAIFIPQFGYSAAAYTTLFTYVLYFVYHYTLAIKIHGKCIFDTSLVIECAVLLVICGAICVVCVKLFVFRLIAFLFLFIVIGLKTIRIEKKVCGGGTR